MLSKVQHSHTAQLLYTRGLYSAPVVYEDETLAGCVKSAPSYKRCKGHTSLNTFIACASRGGGGVAGT